MPGSGLFHKLSASTNASFLNLQSETGNPLEGWESERQIRNQKTVSHESELRFQVSGVMEVSGVRFQVSVVKSKFLSSTELLNSKFAIRNYLPMPYASSPRIFILAGP